MKSIEGLKLINRIQSYILKNGIDDTKVVEDLKKLRPFSIEEEDPTLTKVIRLTYEHIEEFGTFCIPIPDDELDGVVIEAPNANDAVESLNYLLSLMADRTNKVNIKELKEYRDALMNY